MYVYSENINLYLQKINLYIKDILKNECHLDIKRSRIYYQGYTYKINVVTFEDQSKLGHFKSDLLEIGLNRSLLYSVKEKVLKNIIRHELAHFIHFLTDRTSFFSSTSHGQAYRMICKSFGWDKDVYEAKLNQEIANDKIEGDLKSERIIEKVKKLMSLAQSSNQYESELAMTKANQLLFKHNLNLLGNDYNKDQLIYLKRVIKGKKASDFFYAIASILKEFYVSVVFNYGSEGFYIEVSGDKTNVEFAEYICNFLEIELVRLWKQTQKENPHLKGLRAKNSFYRSLAKAFCQKIKNSKSQNSNSKDLIILETKIEMIKEVVYQRLQATSSSGAKTNEEASKLGKKAGLALNIKRPLTNSSKNTFFLS